MAKRCGLLYPEAGMPDIQKIKEVFGFGPEDIRGYTTSVRFQKRTKVPKYISDSEADCLGEHRRYGADVEI